MTTKVSGAGNQPSLNEIMTTLGQIKEASEDAGNKVQWDAILQMVEQVPKSNEDSLKIMADIADKIEALRGQNEQHKDQPKPSTEL